MFLFEHEQHYQSYNAQSSKQRKILAFKEKDYNKRDIPPRLVTSPTLNVHKPRPREHSVHVEKRKSGCMRVHLWVSSNFSILHFTCNRNSVCISQQFLYDWFSL